MWIALAGAAVIAVVLRDLFHTLFHPGGKGAISALVQRGVWRTFRLLSSRHGWLALAGPVAVVVTIGVWFFLAATGWALVYWPYLPDGFRFATALDPTADPDFVDALYLAITAQSTLGFGDITATATWLQILTALQAVAGFTILTASLSWIISIHPALGRQRAAAARATALLDAMDDDGQAGPALERLAADVARARVDLLQNPILYYFHTPEPDVALPSVLQRLYRVATSRDPSPEEARTGKAALRNSIAGLATTLDHQLLDGDDRSPEETLAAYAHDHAYGHAAARSLSRRPE